MKKILIIVLFPFLNGCETKNSEQNKVNVENIIKGLKVEKSDIDAIAQTKKTTSYYGQNDDIFIKNRDTVSTENFDKNFRVTKNADGKIILFQEIEDTEDEYTTVSYYFNKDGAMFFNSIESFHFENPCQNGEIKDLKFIKKTFYNKSMIVNNEEFLIDDKNIKYKVDDCTFNGVTEIHLYKSLKDIEKQNKKLFDLFSK